MRSINVDFDLSVACTRVCYLDKGTGMKIVTVVWQLAGSS